MSRALAALHRLWVEAWGFSPRNKFASKGALAPALLLAASAFAQTKFVLPETNSTITVTVTHDKQFPNDYRSIAIHASETTTCFLSHEPFIRIPATLKERKEADIWNADIPGLKIDPSRFFLVGQYTANNQPHTLLFFLSPGYASDAASILVIGFSSQGKPSRLFEREYEMTSFEQTESGALLTGKQTLSQGVCISDTPNGPSAASYDPFSIFLIQPDSKPTYQLRISRDYNLKHYTWAGERSSEKLTVLENFPGRPKFFAVPATQTAKFLAKVKCY